MRQMAVKITTLSPVVLTMTGSGNVMTETHDVVSGSVLRGVLANHYIREKNLGGAAHEDADFRRLFFGALRFVDANLAETDDSGERRSFRLPFSLQKEKATGEEPPQIEDLMRKDKPSPGMKSFSGYAVLKDGYVQPLSPKKDISMHMSRMNDKERRMGRSNDGGIYSYESLEAGQVFLGAVLGEESDLRALRDSVPQSLHCRVGRSKFAQYGLCSLELGDISEVCVPGAKDLFRNAIILRLDTPFLPEVSADGMATAEKGLAAVAASMNERTGSSAFSVHHIHAAAAEIENYVGVWGMKRPREAALAAGTVFALEKSGEWTAEDFTTLSAIMHEGVGRRTEEGFGQLRLWPEINGIYKKPGKQEHLEQEQAFSSMAKVSEAVAEKAREIFAYRLKEQLRVYAADDVRALPANFSGLTHFFGRLDQMLTSVGQGSGNREAYSNLLREKVRPRSPMETNLHKVVANGWTLFDMLREKQPLPYENRDWKTALSGKAEKTAACMKAIGLEEKGLAWDDGAYFYEYWHWFFRYARKKAAGDQRKGGKSHA